MTESKVPDENLAAEFRELGKNLADALRAGWESPERKKLQQDIENGLSELTTSLREEVDNWNESPTGQRLKSNVQDVRQRIRNGDAETLARQELLNVLQTVNNELRRATNQWTANRSTEPTDKNPSEPS
jgi:hypothetical protein